MSNLIKNVYFTVDEEDKRVINSDDYGMMNGAKVLDFALELGGK